MLVLPPARQDTSRFWLSQVLVRPLLSVKVLPTAAELNNLGGTAFTAGKYAEAIPLFQKAVALDPGDRFYVANLAASLRKTSRFEDAQAVLTTAMAA